MMVSRWAVGEGMVRHGERGHGKKATDAWRWDVSSRWLLAFAED